MIHMTQKFKKTVWNKQKKPKLIKNKVKSDPRTIWNKTKKKKQSNKNKKNDDLKKIVSNIGNWETDPIVEKYTPSENKRDYRLVAYESRWLDPEWDQYRFCEVTYELTGEKVNTEDIHHIEGRAGSKYNDPTNLIFVSREVHERISKYPIPRLKNIVKKYLLSNS